LNFPLEPHAEALEHPRFDPADEAIDVRCCGVGDVEDEAGVLAADLRTTDPFAL